MYTDLATMTRHEYAVWLTIGATSHPNDWARLGMALREAKRLGFYDEAVAHAMQQRKGWLTTTTLWQRKWGTDISRRPARAGKRSWGFDTSRWAVRERYVTCK